MKNIKYYIPKLKFNIFLRLSFDLADANIFLICSSVGKLQTSLALLIGYFSLTANLIIFSIIFKSFKSETFF